MRKEKDFSDTEVKLLFTAINDIYGYDFLSYAPPVMKRRVKSFISDIGAERIADIIPEIIYSKNEFSRLFNYLTITVSEFFRDPVLFKAYRNYVIPLLKTYPYPKIWIAGCATGLEAYSFAILLKEEGLLERSQIFATDINENALAVAKTGIYKEDVIDLGDQNYRASLGKKNFLDYFEIKDNEYKIKAEIQKKITFANHNLTTDWVFTEAHTILCRNVMIYFQDHLQKRVLKLFQESLQHSGVLCLGSKESLLTNESKHLFIPFIEGAKIYKINHTYE